MKPYFTDSTGTITIYHGDCREILPSIKADVVVTDPPYGIGIAANPFRQRHAKSDWDDRPVDDELLQLAIGERQAIVWGGNYFDLPPQQNWLVWDKEQPEDFSSAMCELAWTNLGGPAKMFRMRVVGYHKSHPTQKPLELMRWCIEKTTGDTILDPFMGSGTTLRAAKDLGRRAIGIEIEERYAEIAAKRLSQEVLRFEDGMVESRHGAMAIRQGSLLEERKEIP